MDEYLTPNVPVLRPFRINWIGGLILSLFLFIRVLTPGVLFGEETRATFLSIDPGTHVGSISAVAISSDGATVITAGRDKTIRIWDVSGREEPQVIRTHIGPGDQGVIHDIALSPDGKQLAFVGTLSDQAEVRLVDMEKRQIFRSLSKDGDGSVTGVLFSPDGRYVGCFAGDEMVLWDVTTGRFILKIPAKGIARFTSDSRYVIAGNKKEIKTWELRSGRVVSKITLDVEMMSLRIKRNTTEILVDCYSKEKRDRHVELWNYMRRKKIKRIIKLEEKYHQYGLLVGPGDNYIVTAENTALKKIWVYDAGGRFVGTHHLAARATGHRFSADGRRLLLTTETGFEVLSLSDAKRIYLKEGTFGRHIAFADNGGIAFAWMNIDVFDSKREKSILSIRPKARYMGEVAFAKAGNAIAWGEKEGVLTERLAMDGTRLQHHSGPLNKKDYIFEIEKVGSLSVRRENSKLKIVYNNKKMPTPYGWQAGVTLTPDGRRILRGFGWAYLQGLRPSGETVKKYSGHAAEVWQLAPSPDSARFVSAALDRTVKLWNIGSGRLLLTVFQGTDGEWVAWTPEGYYDASVKGEKYIGWHINQGPDKSALFFPAKRFAKKFYAPEVVANYITTGGNLTEAVRLANAGTTRTKRKKIVTREVFRKAIPPVVYFLNPDSRAVDLSTDRLHIKAQARSVSGEPIKDIWVTLNGTRVDKTRGIMVGDKRKLTVDSPKANLSLTLKLTEPVNRIALFAETDQARSEPEVITVRLVDGSTDREFKKPDLYLLSIGVSDYRNTSYNLDVAHKDALGLAKVLKSQEGRIYRRVHAKVLTNNGATKGEILDGLDWISQQATQKDMAVVFVAGHGLKDNLGSYYFLPHDGDVDKLRRTAVKWIDFHDVVSNLPTKTLFLIDTCHSGSVTGKRRAIQDMTDVIKELMQSDSGLVVMTASTGREFSAEKPEWGHGAFTKALIEGLNGKADYNGNKRVEIKELDLYITERVKKLTGGRQHPTTEIPNTLPNFPIALY